MLLKYYQKLDDAISYLFSSVCNEEKLIKSIFSQKKITYIDIGSNEGSYLGFLLSFCNFKKIVCFEPIVELAKKISDQYSDQNIEVFSYAISNKVSKKKFYQYQISSQSSLYRQNDTFQSLKKLKRTIKLKTTKFDLLFNKNAKIDFCKIDVQGEEMNVLKGMEKNLKKGKINLIKIEISFLQRYHKSKPNFYEIINFLKKYNYFVISISKVKFKNNKILLMDAFFQLQNQR